MEVKLNQIDPTSASLTISIAEADYKPQVDAKLKDHAKKANIKGFRPGKVPPALIKNMMGENILAEEVFNVVTQELNQYIKDNKLALIGDPLPAESEKNRQIDWKVEKDFEFTYDLGTVPEFKIDLSKLQLDKQVVEIEEKTLDETIENIKKQAATSINPEKVDVEDYVTGELTQVDGDHSLEKSMIPMNKAAKTEGKKLVGKAVGDEVTFDLQKLFKKDAASISHVAGVTKEEAPELTGDFTFKITTISRTVDPELNQELFDKVFGEGTVKDEEGFKAKLTESLEENYNNDAKFLTSKQIKEELAKTSVDYSKEFFKRWLLESNKETLTPEDLDTKFDAYETELKWSFVRNKIAEENELKVEAEEVRAKAEEVLRYQMLGGMEITDELRERFNPILDNYLKENNGKNYYQTFDQVMNDKVFSYVLENATIKESKVKSEKFKSIIEEATKEQA